MVRARTIIKLWWSKKSAGRGHGPIFGVMPPARSMLSSSGSVNAENLALAKAKLGVGNVALRRKNTLLSGIF